MKEPDRVRSLQETADILNVSLKTLRRMIDAGDGPRVIRLSKQKIGIRDSDRTAYLDAKVAS
jgi:predicted DNA-binding transcriptional regulator AlpA